MSLVVDHEELPRCAVGAPLAEKLLASQGRTVNPLFQDRICRLVPISARNTRLPGGTTSGGCRLIPVPRGHVEWFDGSRAEVALPYQC
jgi:hypothetical protein